MNLKTLAVLTLCLLVSGCAGSLPRALDEVRAGMDKDQVLEIVGNPKQTYRENMEDHWLYQYFNEDREWKRDVVFSDGKVIRVSRPLAKEEWVKDLERTSSMEEFEEKARAHQKKADNFQSIDGSSGEHNGAGDGK